MAVSERLYKQDRDGSIPRHSILEWTADWNGLESALISSLGHNLLHGIHAFRFA